MFRSRLKWPGATLGASVALCLASGLARAQTFSAPLDQCQLVKAPAALSNCASVQDPLNRGGATIDNEGNVTVLVFGAATDTTYAVTFVSNDGTQTTLLGNLKTDNNGDGALRRDAFFKFGTVGAGNVVLNNSGEEFVTGIAISGNGLESGRDFQPGLVRCTDVTVPGPLSGCGSDSLSSGHVDVENDDGSLSIHVSGARPNTSYTAFFRSPSGRTAVSLGTVGPTNKKGSATLVVTSEFAADTVGSGLVVLQNGTTDEFESGFKVDEKFVPPAASAANLVPCGEVTDPTLSNCGTDPLDVGGYEVNAAGQIAVRLTGAEPSTNYEVFFRPLDDSGELDTGIAVPTNALGNAVVGPKSYFAANTVASGTLVVKRSGSDQPDEFVAGYELH
jgi:hypothetical protein